MSSYEELFNQQLDLSKLSDRGTKKWGAMMLPEHVKLIREYNEFSRREPRPVLEESDLIDIQESVEIAMKRNADVKFKTWHDGAFVHHIGKITWIDIRKRIIEIEDTFQSFSLQLDDIVGVTVID